MAISVRFNDTVGPNFSFGSTFLILCDYCGAEIDCDDPGNAGNIEMEHRDGAPVVFLHKRCSSHYRQGKGKMLWAGLRSVDIQTE